MNLDKIRELLSTTRKQLYYNTQNKIINNTLTIVEEQELRVPKRLIVYYFICLCFKLKKKLKIKKVI